MRSFLPKIPRIFTGFRLATTTSFPDQAFRLVCPQARRCRECAAVLTCKRGYPDFDLAGGNDLTDAQVEFLKIFNRYQPSPPFFGSTTGSALNRISGCGVILAFRFTVSRYKINPSVVAEDYRQYRIAEAASPNRGFHIDDTGSRSVRLVGLILCDQPASSSIFVGTLINCPDFVQTVLEWKFAKFSWYFAIVVAIVSSSRSCSPFSGGLCDGSD